MIASLRAIAARSLRLSRRRQLLGLASGFAAACLGWSLPGAAQPVEGSDWSIPLRPDWRTEVRHFDNPLCLRWTNGPDSCERDPETMRARCTVVPEPRSDLTAVTCTRQNTEVIMRVCDEWGVAGSNRCDPTGCTPFAPAPEEKTVPGIFCIKWKKK
jgi:hypothetical protein